MIGVNGALHRDFRVKPIAGEVKTSPRTPVLYTIPKPLKSVFLPFRQFTQKALDTNHVFKVSSSLPESLILARLGSVYVESGIVYI